ncbi:distal tail protein Dit [Macrococcus capreoli]|uniref:distal tail protein Dit n=1 Tax=Macrococcus capreoli TaxID=2982690 RepID=UPI0021D56A69|nr:distal tail protein Dit [Macrococcus sp. TMW 2.2395]MCU7556528.1 phage tail family protein [Macrococcus sp. TMW 2.2395]
MAYQFRDFGQGATSTSLSIRSIIGGKELETYLKTSSFTFTTLSVSGRGAVEYNVEGTEVTKRHGSVFRERRLKDRKIVIKALVKAATNEAYREGMSALNGLLGLTDLISLKFTDDMSYTYYGYCVRVEDDGEQSNTQIIEIEFTCLDPFKYTDSKTLTYSTASPMAIETSFPIMPTYIDITFASIAEASDFTLVNNNTGKKIVFKGMAVSPTIRINQMQDFIGSIGGENKIAGLQVKYSDFDTLKVSNNDVLWTSPAPSSISLTYRGAKL